MTKCPDFVESPSFKGFSYEKYGCIVCGNYRTEKITKDDNEEIDFPVCADEHPLIIVAFRDFKND